MKYFIILLTILTFTGCTTPIDLAKQEVACEPHGGIYAYGKHLGRYTQCNDGTIIQSSTWYAITGPEVAAELSKIKETQ